MNPKRRAAILVGSTFVVLAPFFAFVLYWSLRLPTDHLPRWFTNTIAIWFVVNIFIVTFLAKRLFKRQTLDNENQESSAKEVPSGGFCYAFGVVFPLVYLFAIRREKQSAFLRFHCIQCIILFLIWSPFLFLRTGPKYILSGGYLLCLVGWLVAMFQAMRRKLFHLPVVGWVAQRLA